MEYVLRRRMIRTKQPGKLQRTAIRTVHAADFAEAEALLNPDAAAGEVVERVDESRGDVLAQDGGKRRKARHVSATSR